MSAEPGRRVRAYTNAIIRHRRSIMLLSVVLALGAGKVAASLPVYADFSYLLPPNAESVQHLRALEKRARVLGTAMLAVRSADPERRRGAALAVLGRVRALPQDAVSSVTFDEHVAHQFAWDNRWLFASLADLKGAHTALEQRLHQAHLRANPLYIDFEDSAALPADAPELVDLRARLRQVETLRDDPGELVSHDKQLQMMIVNTPFAAGDAGRSSALLVQLRSIIATTQTEYPDVEMGIAGDVLTSHEEHRAILNGMLWATCVTIILVLAALLWFYRTPAGVAALFWSLTVGTLSTLMFARLSVGHLNIATAFLTSIVVGNGINFGIMLLARHLEARRTGMAGYDALAVAIGGTFRGTLAASLTAAVAYLSLVVTDFRGFRHFGIIASAGMLFCWICAYTLLPACLAWVEERGLLRPRPEPPLGRWLSRLLPRRLGPVVAVGLGLTLVAGVGTYRFLSDDPYEANFKNLRSESPELLEERRWMHAVDQGFGQGISGGFVIAVRERAQAQALLLRLRALDEGKPERERLFSRVNGLDDALPSDQLEKLALLTKLRALLNDEALANLNPQDRADARALRPPAGLQPLTDADVPEALAWPFIEADGSRGKLVLAMSGWGYEIWDAHDLVRFADTVRALDLGPDTLIGGSAFVFSDMLRLIEHDGPLATLASIVGAMLVILCVVGWRRHALVTLVCGAAGTLMMIAIGALVGLRVNFLDFVALPITIGLGIDYAVNICARERLEGPGQAHRVLETAGGAVFLSSYTTIVGYGSLLVSSNRGIQSFGSAAILGEITCLLAALILAPALLSVLGDIPRPPCSRPNGLPQRPVKTAPQNQIRSAEA